MAKDAEPEGPAVQHFHIVKFKVGRDGQVIVIPPRNAEEHAMYETEFGHPYVDALSHPP